MTGEFENLAVRMWCMMAAWVGLQERRVSEVCLGICVAVDLGGASVLV